MGGAVIIIENDAAWTAKLAEATAEGKTVRRGAAPLPRCSDPRELAAQARGRFGEAN